MFLSQVCEDTFLTYGRKINVIHYYDVQHGHNATTKGAARDAGIWRFNTFMCGASNCVYGSTLSPPRLLQIRDSSVNQ